MINWPHLLFSLDGRIPRSRFWLGVGVLVAFQLFIMIPVQVQNGIDPSLGVTPVWFRNLSLGLDVLCAWPLFAVLAKRQADRDQAPHLAFWLVALLLLFSVCEAFGLTQQGKNFTMVGYVTGLPLLFAVVIAVYELGVRQGTEGPNSYGPDPLS